MSELLRHRSLPSETIVKIAVIVIGTHWHARQSSSIIAPGSTDDAPDRREAEDLAVYFLLETFGTVLDISAAEVEEGLKARTGTAIAEDDEELHQYISAVLRRCLPTLRIMSKWIKLHTTYLGRFSHTITDKFWARHKRFVGGLRDLFPMDLLPGCNEVLEEDLDMRGFVPLARGLSGNANVLEKTAEEALGEGMGEEHPNEVQLMRIADLQVDARLLVQPVCHFTNHSEKELTCVNLLDKRDE
jgi:hypothetical protein